jgi:hypothetical protein
MLRGLGALIPVFALQVLATSAATSTALPPASYVEAMRLDVAGNIYLTGYFGRPHSAVRAPIWPMDWRSALAIPST